MKHKQFTRDTFAILILLFVQVQLWAQQDGCVFKEPIVKIDFGTGWNMPRINIFPLSNYQSAESTCPEDGYYSYVSATSDCFNGDWLTFKKDHTGNENGRMMLVNASPEGGVFFNTVVTGLKGNTIYQLAASMVNVCRISGGCPPLPPNILMKLLTKGGQLISSFQTGLLSQGTSPHWKVYSGLFATPADVSTLILTMEDMTTGGCGNDFALDDIILRECIKPAPVAKLIVKQEVKRVAATTKPVVKKTPAVNAEVKKIPVRSSPEKDVALTTIKRKAIDIFLTNMPVIKEKPSVMPAPKVISTRANPLIKQIEAEAGEVQIDLYDNGEVDGDTVSVYDNNKLIVSRAGLSTKPVSFRIKIDTLHSNHELIMVANNLGSIPPNTSIMVITTNNKRYEVFISSTEQKNAKIVINLKDKN